MNQHLKSIYTSIIPENNVLFQRLFNEVITLVQNYYTHKISFIKFHDLFKKLSCSNLLEFFSQELLNTIEEFKISYIEAILILYLENKKPKFVSIINRGTFNLILKIKLNSSNILYALRVSGNCISKINLTKKSDYYDNILFYTNLQLKKYLLKYGYIIDSSFYNHIINENEKEGEIYFTHWSVSKVYTQFTEKNNISYYKYKYIHKVQELLKYFDKNEIYYYDWKIYNFGIDDSLETSGNNNLVLLDIDFESPLTIMNICSTHRLTPDPLEELKLSQLLNSPSSVYKNKIIIAKILMYISAYLSMISFYNSSKLTDYNITFKRPSEKYKFINDNDTINCVIKHLTNNLYLEIPSKLTLLKDLYVKIKNEILNLHNKLTISLK